MKVLVTGSKGQLGTELRALGAGYTGFDFTFIDIEELDLSVAGNIDNFFSSRSFDAIVNCAAYTAVDKAEQEQELAGKLNRDLPGRLAGIAQNMKAVFIHISTDYVFDGQNFRPYTEEDVPNPLSAYAKSKYAGELEIRENSKDSIIIRTSWLYSSSGTNFVKTILRLASEQGRLKVVYDQVGCPTYARDLAKIILDILPAARTISGIGVFHYSNEGAISWYDFAKAIVELSGIPCIIEPIETRDFPTPAVRPFYSVLNKARIKKQFNIEIPYWKDSLSECLRQLKSTN